jgi:hypothetical protein
MEWEWPVWKLVVEKGIPLSEIRKWSLTDLCKALDYMEMQDDHQSAYNEFQNQKLEKKYGQK